MSTEGAGHMPIAGSRLVDSVGMQLVHDWIRSLKSPAASPRDPISDTAAPVATMLADSRSALALVYHATFGPPAQRDEAAAAANRSTNALVRDLFQRLLPPNRRRQTLGAEFDPRLVLSLPGDMARGREVFIGAAQCSRCHRTSGGEGRAFGPDLAGLSRKYSRAQLLDEIRFPSRTIAPEFKLTTITLRDDTELSGFVIQRSTEECVLCDETLAERRVKLVDVKETRESLLSAMPEGLLAPLTAQETADLVEYLHRQ
jgi:putative heme-binding domain-containing protein